MELKIAFFGTPKIAANTLGNLINSKFKPQLVVTGADIQSGRGRKLASNPTKEVAQVNKIKTLEPEKLDKNFVHQLKEFAPDVAVLIAYGKIIPDEVLTIPKFGFVNIHPSLLPKYRGPSPITSAILNDEKVTGVTLIVLDSELDHGPIISQQTLSIDDLDTHESLAKKLADLGTQTIIKIMPAYLNQNISPKPQDHKQATYTEKLTKNSGKIDLKNPPSPELLDRMIRAYYPWPVVWTEIEGKRFKLLPDAKIQPEGKKPMSYQEFKNGYGKYKELLAKIIP